MNGREASATLLEVRDLSVRYRTGRGELHAVEGFSAHLPSGRTMGIVGESGSGKSTVALALMGLLPPQARLAGGSVRLDGEELTTLPPERLRSLRGRRIGMVFQDPFLSLNPSLTVGAQVAEPLEVHRGQPRAAALAEAIRLLDSVGIPRAGQVAASYPHQLSGGMRQRAMIASALACDPALLVLDEPTTALDVTIEAQILDLLLDLQRGRGVALLLISHNLGVIRRVAQEVCVMYAGQVVERGETAAVLARPDHPYTRGLMGSVPRLGGHRRLTPIPGNLPDLVSPPEGCIFAPRCPAAQPPCRAPQALRRMEVPAGVPDHLVRCCRAPLTASAPTPEAPGHDPGPIGQAAVLEVRDLHKSFAARGWAGRLFGADGAPPPRAVDGVSLSIQPGEIVGLVGESGSGKSTLGRCIVRLEEPDGGAVRFDGQDLLRARGGSLRRAQRAAQMIFQNPSSSLNPRLTVAEALARPARLAGTPRASLAARVAELLELVRLPAAYAGRYPHQLSGGERQRVGIARALATRPRLLVCDEPVSALDVSVQASVLNLLAELRDRTAVAMLFISHDLSVVAHLADRVSVLYRGRLVEVGRTADVLRAPNHPYTEALLSAVPALSGEGGRVRLRGEIGGAAPSAGCVFSGRCHRHIGPVCDTVPPPDQVPAPGHHLLCHLPPDVLAAR